MITNTSPLTLGCRRHTLSALLVYISALFLASQSAQAVSGTWSGAASDGLWATSGNWSALPGSADTATFNTTPGTAISLGTAAQSVKSITFDTSVGSFTFNTGGTGGQFNLTSAGAITLASTATGTNLVQTFNAPISLGGSYAFTNLRADTGSALVFNGNITNTATSTLTINGTGTGTGNIISGNISNGTGVQSVTKGDSGKWTLSGANSYSGLTTVSSGTLVLSGTNSSAGATTLTAGTLQLNNATNGGLASGALTMAGGTLQSLLASQSISNNVLLTGITTVSGTNSITLNGSFTNSGGNRILNGSITGNTLTLAGNVYLSELTGTGRTLTIGGGGATVISGAIANFNSGAGTAGILSITNTSSTTLSGANTYSGGTIIGSSSGAIGAPVNVSTIGNVGGASSNLGTAGVLTIGSGAANGQLVYTGVGETTDRVVNLGGNGGNDGTGGKAMITQSAASGLLKFTSNLTSTGVGSKTLTLQGSTAGTGEISGVIVDNTGFVSHTVNTAFNSGVTSITVNNTQGDFGVGATISGSGIAAGTTITAIATVANVSTLTLSTPTTGAGSSGASTTVAGGLTGVIKSGTGTWTLSVANTYSGVTTINGGVLAINTITNVGGGASSLGAPTTIANGTIALVGGTLKFTGSSSGSSDRVINLAGGTTDTLDASGTATFALSGGITGNRALFLQGSGLGTESGNIAVTNQPLTKNGTGTWVLSGVNSYTTGITTVSQGTLEFANPGSLYNSLTTNWTAAHLITQSGATLAFNVGTGGFTSGQIDTLKTNLIGGGTASAGFEAGSTIALDTTGQDFTYNTAIGNNSVSGAIGLTKLGTNTLTLGGVNTYTGATTISAGKLALGASGAINANSAITVASGATFDTSAQSYTFSTLKTTTIGVNGTAAGLITAAAVTFSSANLAFDFGSTATLLSSYTVLTTTGITGDFTGVSATGTSISGSFINAGSGNWTLTAGGYDLTFSESLGTLTSVAAAIPEPATYALFGGVIALLGTVWLRRRRQVRA